MSIDPESEGPTPFESFLLSEYNNIASAHFNTVDAISTWVKHYIVLAAVPLSVAAFALSPEHGKRSVTFEFLASHPAIPTAILQVATAVSFCVLAYLVNLRCDALLYARVVNGIRSHFYATSALSGERLFNVRVLPRSTSLPRYFEPFFFSFVVAAFALVSAGYYRLEFSSSRQRAVDDLTGSTSAFPFFALRNISLCTQC